MDVLGDVVDCDARTFKFTRTFRRNISSVFIPRAKQPQLSITEAKNGWYFASTPPYAFMGWCVGTGLFFTFPKPMHIPAYYETPSLLFVNGTHNGTMDMQEGG